MCRGGVDEAVELCTPFHRDYRHPAKMYVSHNYHWPSRTQFCNDDRIHPTACSNNYSCKVSPCVSATIPETTYLYTAFHEETCSTDSSNDIICQAIQTHFNVTEWYRHDVARHCVVVASEDCMMILRTYCSHDVSYYVVPLNTHRYKRMSPKLQFLVQCNRK